MQELHGAGFDGIDAGKAHAGPIKGLPFVKGPGSLGDLGEAESLGCDDTLGFANFREPAISARPSLKRRFH